MKRTLIEMAALIFILGIGPALAQTGHPGSGGQNNPPPPQNAQPTVRKGGYARPPAPQQQTQQPQQQAQRPDRNARDDNNRRDNNRGMNRNPMAGPGPARANRYDWNGYRPGARPPDWRAHRSENLRGFQANLRARQRYHAQSYARPSGWYYRRWVYGQIFPRAFWSRDYWLTDYWDYGLMDPPYGYVWVRYGSDAVLVSVQTGVIIRVVYDLFY